MSNNDYNHIRGKEITDVEFESGKIKAATLLDACESLRKVCEEVGIPFEVTGEIARKMASFGFSSRQIQWIEDYNNELNLLSSLSCEDSDIVKAVNQWCSGYPYPMEFTIPIIAHEITSRVMEGIDPSSVVEDLERSHKGEDVEWIDDIVRHYFY